MPLAPVGCQVIRCRVASSFKTTPPCSPLHESGLRDNRGMRLPAPLLIAALAAALPAIAQDKLPEGPGKAAVVKVCHACHSPDVVATKHRTREEWEHAVVDMINAGA